MLKAGFSRVDVTPPLGTSLEGYFQERHAVGILDPLYLNAVAISVNDNTVVIITADFEMLNKKYADKIRATISERVKLPVDNIMICTLHPHTSIAIRDTKNNNVMEDKSYLELLWRKFSDVAEMAINDLSEAKLYYGIKETDVKLSFIRRYLLKDGTYMTNPFSRLADVVRTVRDADNNVRLLRFKRDEKNDIALVNFSTHPDVIGGSQYSADWPGFTRRFVERDLENVSCLLINGVQGDANHYDFTSELKSGYSHSEFMGRTIANTVIKLWDNLTPEVPDKLSCGYEVVYNKTRTDGLDDYDEALKISQDPDKGKYTGAELGNSSRILKLRQAPIFQTIPVTAINLGKIGFVGLGGEPFTQYGDDLRAAAPDRFIIASCCTNGGEGYLPTTEAFKEGGYEASSSPFSPDIEEQCINAATALLNK